MPQSSQLTKEIIMTLISMPKDGNHQILIDRIEAANADNELKFETNVLQGKTAAELSEIFRAIPDNVTTLNLSGQSLFDTHGLNDAIAAIPAHITTLNLQNNCLFRKRDYELKPIFGAIPQNVTTLDISKNEMPEVPSDRITAILETIPATVTIRHQDKTIHEILDAYLDKRIQYKGYNGNPLEYFSIFSFFGYSLTAKQKAIGALKAALADNAAVTVSDADLGALENGTLGQTLTQYIKSRSTEGNLFHLNGTTTIRDFVTKLNQSIKGNTQPGVDGCGVAADL